MSSNCSMPCFYIEMLEEVCCSLKSRKADSGPADRLQVRTRSRPGQKATWPRHPWQCFASRAAP